MDKASFAASGKEPAGSRAIFAPHSLHLSSKDLLDVHLNLKISAYEVAPVLLLNRSRSLTQPSTPLLGTITSFTISLALPIVLTARIAYNKSFAQRAFFFLSSLPV